MTGAEIFNPLDFLMLPQNNHTVSVGGEFYMTKDEGDVERPDKDEVYAKQFMYTPFPLKIMFSLGILCRKGNMRIRINLTEYTIHENDLLMVAPGTIGECCEISPDLRVMVIAFAGDFLHLESGSQHLAIISKMMARKPLINLTTEEVDDFLFTCRQLEKKLEQTDFAFKRQATQSYVQLLIYDLCQFIMKRPEMIEGEMDSRKQQILNEFLEIVQKEFASQRSITYYAKKLGFTPKYLSHVIFTVSGRRAGDWIRDYVILNAKAMLKSNQYSIEQISTMLSFPNSSFFGTYFKRATGCSPKAYQHK